MLAYSRFAARIVALIISKIQQETRAGISGKDLEQIAISMIRKNRLKSSSLGYGGFPASICVSVNNELTHGIPTSRPFKCGDLVSVDVACSYKGFHADAASTFIVEEKKFEVYDREDFLRKKTLLEVTKRALANAIQSIVPARTTTSDIGNSIESYVKKSGFFVIKEFGGHGIGKMLHMDPFIPNFMTKMNVQAIESGMLICIEPLVQMNNDLIKISKNGTTVESLDGSLNAHFEHTILVKDNDVEILTIIKDSDESFFNNNKDKN